MIGLLWQDNFLLQAAQAVNLIMRSNAYPPDTLRNYYTCQGPREGLFVHMRMEKYPRSQDRAIRRNNHPAVRVVVPPGIIMPDGHREGVIPVGAPCDLNGYDVCLPGRDGYRTPDQENQYRKTELK